jgi:exonuclease III
MSKRLYEHLTSIKKISERIMKAEFAGNPATTLIIVYAPTNDKSQNIKDEFYNDLLKCKNEVPHHNLLLIAGDFNARIGVDSHHANPRVVGRHAFHETTNENGQKLVDFCEAADIRPAQHRFPHPKSRVWTWQHPTSRNKNTDNRAQLDHILVNGKWLNSIKNIRAYDTVEINSDHRIVSIKIKISLRKTEKSNLKRCKFNWDKLQHNDIQSQFNIAVKNRYESLRDESDDL